MAFNSKDGVHIVSRDSLIECATVADKCASVGVVRINCTPPRFIFGLILSIRKVMDEPILIYPNSGERYDGEKKDWVGSSLSKLKLVQMYISYLLWNMKKQGNT